MYSLAFLWPVLLVVAANTIYHISAKSQPADLNPMAAMTVTYFVSTVVSALLFFACSRGGNLILEYKKLNWAPFVLGISIVGLEVGFIYAYKVGWLVSLCSIVTSALLAVILVIVGVLLFHEQLTWNRILGLVICLVGLYFINLK